MKLRLILLSLLLVGCAVSVKRPPSKDCEKYLPGKPRYQVRIETATGIGSGILIDQKHVVTVNHVVDELDAEERITVHWGQATRIAHLESRISIPPDGLVVLHLTAPLPILERPHIQRIRGGDSGSPIHKGPAFGQDGQIIGLVMGYQYRRTGNIYFKELVGQPLDAVRLYKCERR